MSFSGSQDRLQVKRSQAKALTTFWMTKYKKIWWLQLLCISRTVTCKLWEVSIKWLVIQLFDLRLASSDKEITTGESEKHDISGFFPSVSRINSNKHSNNNNLCGVGVGIKTLEHADIAIRFQIQFYLYSYLLSGSRTLQIGRWTDYNIVYSQILKSSFQIFSWNTSDEYFYPG